MPRKRLSDAAYERSYQHEQQYIKESYKWVNIQFNKKIPEDMELYDFLKSQPEKIAPFIKNLIRQAMKGAE